MPRPAAHAVQFVCLPVHGVVLPAQLIWLALLLSGGGINNIPSYEEQAKAKWSDVHDQYRRRAELIPNLVEYSFGGGASESW
jgi:LemA protein